MTPTPAIERIEASPPSVASRSAFEWSCLLRHDGDYDQETRDAFELAVLGTLRELGVLE